MNIRKPFNGNFPISQRYGEKITSSFHTGIDFALPYGTPVVACADGVVVKAGVDHTGYGVMVILKHADGSGSVYAHIDSLTCAIDDVVDCGAVIGLSGNSGKSTGAHLHFERRRVALDWRTHFAPETFAEIAQSPVESPAASSEMCDSPGDLVVVGAYVNARKTPGLSAPLIGGLAAGARVRSIGTPVRQDGIVWRKVAIPEMVAWMAMTDGAGNALMRSD